MRLKPNGGHETRDGTFFIISISHLDDDFTFRLTQICFLPISRKEGSPYDSSIQINSVAVFCYNNGETGVNVF